MTKEYTNTIEGLSKYINSLLQQKQTTINALASFGGQLEYNIIEEEFTRLGISSTSVREKVRHIIQEIKSAEENYKSGLIFEAYSSIYDLLFNEFEDKILDERIIPENNYFFRLRSSSIEYLFKKEDLFHIPFEQRHKVGNQRYSISGYPCLYLGNSIYGCWEELNRPPINTTNIAALKNTVPIKLLDFRMPLKFTSEKDFCKAALIIACSIKVEKPLDPFKPEYIISQAVLHSLVRFNKEARKKGNRGIHGVIYKSTHTNNDDSLHKEPELFDNIVIPVVNSEIKDKGFCETLCNEFLISDPISLNIFNLSRDATATYVGEGNNSTPIERYTTSIFGILERDLRAELSGSDYKLDRTKYWKISKDSIPERFRNNFNSNPPLK